MLNAPEHAFKGKQQDYWSFYASEPFTLGHFDVRHPENGLKIKKSSWSTVNKSCSLRKWNIFVQLNKPMQKCNPLITFLYLEGHWLKLPRSECINENEYFTYQIKKCNRLKKFHEIFLNLHLLLSCNRLLLQHRLQIFLDYWWNKICLIWCI